MSDRSVLLLGATGLVGRHTLRLLAADDRWGRVVTLDRRPLAAASASHEPHVVDFDRLDAHSDALACDDVICCLGTTMKQAGSEDAFRRVDLEIPVEVAERAHRAGASRYLLVSALGADPDSRFFYNRTKGQAEQAIRTVGFDAVQIVQPSLLAGDREEVRLGERVGLAALRVARPVLIGPLTRLRPTQAEDVARALVAVAAVRPEGHHVYGPDEIRSAARRIVPQ